MNVESISIFVQNLKKKFKTQVALDGVTMNFNAGMMHGVIGPDGAGKTTLMRLILKLLNPDAGTIEFKKNGTVIDFEEIRPLVAYMPQSQNLYPDLSIREHLEFFRDMYELSAENYKRLSTELLAVTRLEPFVNRPAGQLSGGMYKKLGLMCALLRSPQVILLDEPTNGVDPISRREFWELLTKLMEQKILIIVTTSYMNEASLCTEVHLIEDGHVIAEGEPKQLLQQENVKSFDELFIQHAKKNQTMDSAVKPRNDNSKSQNDTDGVV